MEKMLNEVFGSMGNYLPSLLAALVVLVIGWIIARMIEGIIRGGLRRLELNRRITAWTKAETEKDVPDIENGVAKGAYFLVMLFVLIAFFQTLRITLITEPLTAMLNQLFQFAPQLLGAALLLLAAWVVAKLCQIGVSKMLIAIKFDERLGSKICPREADQPEAPKPVALSKSLADAVYGIVFLLFLPAILDALSLQGLLTPVQGMIDKILSFLPNLVTAGIIFLVGWFVARLVQQIVTNLLVAVGTDSFSEKIGLAKALGNQKLSSVCGVILYAFILIPVAIAGLNTLQLDSITQPASNMLNMILAAIPNIFAAFLIVAIGFILGRVVSTMVANLLAGIGFDGITASLGVCQEKTEGTMVPSQAVGHLTMVTILFFSALEACDYLGFTALTQLLHQFLVLAGHVLFGVIIFAIGLLAANTVNKIVLSSGVEKANLLATVARVAILIFSGAMGLQQMGLANDILNMTFGLLIGAIALAIAIAFGLGARDIAARELDGWINAFKDKTK